MASLLERWSRLHTWSPQVDAEGTSLLARYGEAHRHYHDQRHLAEVLDALDLLGAADDAVRLAAFFHDAVYDVRTTGEANEVASAELASSVLSGLGHPPTHAAEVSRLVLLTATHDPSPDDEAGRLLCDADLAVLAADDARYRQYAADVRAEYAHVPDDAFAAGRTAVLGQLLGHDRLFTTSTGHAMWEKAARANVQAELRSLSAGSGR